jgi:hypothetical protein
LGERSADGLGRRGEVGDAGVLRLLWTVIRRKLDVLADLELGEGLRLVLTMRQGRLVRMAGPIAMRVIDMLRRDEAIGGRPTDEAEAQRLLELRLRAGQLSRFEYHRLQAGARQHLLYEAVASRGGTFHLRPLEPAGATGDPAAGQPARGLLVRGGLAAALVEGARQRLDVQRVRRLLAAEQGVMFLGPEAPARFLEAAIEPEIVALLLDCEGATLDALMATGPPDAGMPGLVFALLSIGGLSFGEGRARVTPAAAEPAAVRAAIGRMHRTIIQADYFQILDLSPDASLREVRAAYDNRLGYLQSVVVGPGTDLAAQKDEVRDALTEAFRVLRHSGLREAYRQALFPGAHESGEAPTSPGFFR